MGLWGWRDASHLLWKVEKAQASVSGKWAALRASPFNYNHYSNREGPVDLSLGVEVSMLGEEGRVAVCHHLLKT